MAQDHFMVCFTISLFKCDNGCCLFAIKIFCYASHDVSTVLLGRLHCGNVQLKFLSWVLITRFVVQMLIVAVVVFVLLMRA